MCVCSCLPLPLISIHKRIASAQSKPRRQSTAITTTTICQTVFIIITSIFSFPHFKWKNQPIFHLILVLFSRSLCCPSNETLSFRRCLVARLRFFLCSFSLISSLALRSVRLLFASVVNLLLLFFQDLVLPLFHDLLSKRCYRAIFIITIFLNAITAIIITTKAAVVVVVAVAAVACSAAVPQHPIGSSSLQHPLSLCLYSPLEH